MFNKDKTMFKNICKKWNVGIMDRYYFFLYMFVVSFIVLFFSFLCNQEKLDNYCINTSNRAITERKIVVSNRTFNVQYEYSTNVVPYHGEINTNIPIIIQRRAYVTVFEIIGTNKTQIDGIMRGIIITTGNFDEAIDWFYVLKALSSTNQP